MAVNSWQLTKTIKKTDFLVIGSGIAGLYYALKAADFGKVTILTKASLLENTTRYAQGGIAAVVRSPDSVEKHVEDTILCGKGLCDEKIVRMVISEGPKRINDLINIGTRFDKSPSGDYDLGREGGHSENRVLHYKDSTGQEIIRALVQAVKDHPEIEIFEKQFVVEIITQHHLGKKVKKNTTGIECYGAYVLDPGSGQINTFLSRVTLMATGGIGVAYQTTTNPDIVTGDGIAMVYRAKGVVENMEFVQFHPTSLYDPLETPSFLITEALRGFGGVLRNSKEQEFMKKYDDRGSLAPRDVVARAIDNEMKLSGEDYVYLDCRHIDKAALKRNFPNIYRKCRSAGIDITKEMIPVVPAAHYICGGIKTDEHGRSTINRLYAAGECASTGMHGANRMASNSLLEAAVFANRAAQHSAKTFQNYKHCLEVPPWDTEGTVLNEEMVLITQSLKEVQGIMSNYVGIVRSNLRLERALKRLNLLYQETEELYIKSILTPKLCELRNVINVAYLIIKMAINRKESRGLHYSLDYSEGSF